MRVLMLSWEYPPHVVGGLGKHVMELTPALGRQGAEVHLVTPAWSGGPPDESGLGFEIHRVAPPERGQADLFDTAIRANVALAQRAEQLQTELGGFDVLHVHDWLVAFAAFDLQRALQMPLVATVHATELGRGGGHLLGSMAEAIHGIERRLVHEAQRVIVTSEYMAKQILESFDVSLEKVDVVPNGVDTDRFDQYDGMDLSDFRARFARPEQRIVYYVGRVEYQKGVHTLLEAVPAVLAKVPEARFVMAGRGGELDNLRRQANQLGLESSVLFTGFISDSDRDRLYRVADVAVFPSLYEPFGIVALEAMAARCPLVVSEVGGLKEVVRYCEDGWTVHPGSPDSVAWGIVRALTGPEEARKMAAAGYRMVCEQYNWDSIAAQTIAAYERAKGGRG